MPKVKRRTVKITARPKAIVRHHPRVSVSLTDAQKFGSEIAEILMTGAFPTMSAEKRIGLHNALCGSLGLNPLSRPFDYIEISGKWVIYANKSCAEQLRKIHGVSILSHDVRIEENLIFVSVKVQDRSGRTDFATGCVPLPVGAPERANAIMKASTKAKRRATLSICGLGFVDESELDTVNITARFSPEGRVVRYPQSLEEAVEARDIVNPALKAFEEREKEQLAAITGSPQQPKEKTDATPQKPAKDARIAPNSEVRPPAKQHEDGPARPDSGKPAAKPATGRDAKPAPAEHGTKGDAPRHDRIPGPPRADIPGDLHTVVGTLGGVTKGVTKSKSDFRKVVVKPTGTMYFCFDNKERVIDRETKYTTFQLLDEAKPGVAISFLCRSRTVDGKPMPELVTLLRISNLEWETDGTPIIQRGFEMREPGEDVE